MKVHTCPNIVSPYEVLQACAAACTVGAPDRCCLSCVCGKDGGGATAASSHLRDASSGSEGDQHIEVGIADLHSQSLLPLVS
jgi:hypothetical protein